MQVLSQNPPLVLLHREQVCRIGMLLPGAVLLLSQVYQDDLNQALARADIQGSGVGHEQPGPLPGDG